MSLLLLTLIWIPFSLVFYSYIVYPILVSLLAKHFEKKTSIMKPTTTLSVGILIPAYNEERVIRQKIENALKIDYPSDNISVWVGSDQSNDATESIVREMMQRDDRIHLWVSPDRGGKTQVVNRLIQLIDKDLVLLTDANTMHRPNCLTEMTGYFSDNTVGGVAGRIIHIANESERELSEDIYRNYEVFQKCNESKLNSCISAFGGFYLIRKADFTPIPFNAYSNDDVLIPMNIIRSGKRMIFEPKAISEEDLTCDLETEYKRRVRIGAGNYQSFSWLLDFLNPMKGWPSFCYVSHKAIRWFSALLLLTSYVALVGFVAIHPKTLYSVLLIVITGGITATIIGYKFFSISKLRPAYYFIVMNIALIHGFFRFAKGIKSAAWSRTERVDSSPK